MHRLYTHLYTYMCRLYVAQTICTPIYKYADYRARTMHAYTTKYIYMQIIHSTDYIHTPLYIYMHRLYLYTHPHYMYMQTLYMHTCILHR